VGKNGVLAGAQKRQFNISETLSCYRAMHL